jgi:hypothetical protein
MKYLLLTLCLVTSCALTAQSVANNNIGAETYSQPPEELASLEAMARADAEMWRVALDIAQITQDTFVPFRDTVLAQYIVYADLDGNVKYVEDVQVIRMANRYQRHERPRGLNCLRILMAVYYLDE